MERQVALIAPREVQQNFAYLRERELVALNYRFLCVEVCQISGLPSREREFIFGDLIAYGESLENKAFSRESERKRTTLPEKERKCLLTIRWAISDLGCLPSTNS